MKPWMRKKRFRLAVRCAVGGVSLLVLVYTSVNWWGAREKQRAIAEAREAGISVTLAEVMADMPPPEENFAMIPFFVALEREYATRSPGDIPPTSARGRYDAMADSELFGAEISRIRGKMRRAEMRGSRDGGSRERFDFSLMPEGNPYGRSAASFLEEYDRRHGDLLLELREGLSRPYSRRPLVPDAFDGKDWLGLSDRFATSSLYAMNGLVLRAEAALATGDPAKAAESVVIGLRLAEMIGSKGIVITSLIEWSLFHRLTYSLKAGFEKHAWSEEELDEIREELLRMNPRPRFRKAMQGEIFALQVWEGWRDDRSRYYRDQNIHTMHGKDQRRWFFRAARYFPRGWFDLNGASVVRACVENSRVVAGDGPAISWSEDGGRLRAMAEKKKGSDLHPSNAHGVLLERCAYAMVKWRQSILACELERHYVRHGEYPSDLSGFPEEIIRDPLHGTPFLYRGTDEGFLLYSTGPDGKDDGGDVNPHQRWSDQPDWVW